VAAALRVGICGSGADLGQTGGVQVYVRELVAALARHDSPHEYVLIATPDGGPVFRPADPRFSVAELAWPGGRPVPKWRTRLLKLGVASADPFSAQIDALGLDVVHYPATRMREVGLRTPVVLTFFDMQEEFFPGFFPLRERLGRSWAHRRAVSRAAVVIAPSRFTAASLEERYRTPSHKIVCIPAGVGSQYRPEAPAGERKRLAARYGLPEGGFVLYPANPWPHKNHERLFRALDRLRQQRGRALPIVCTGRLQSERQSIAARAKAAGLDPAQVRDLGFVDAADMPALYRAARLLAFPTLFEGFGLPVLEAMASGCPVVCSDIPALREIGGDAVRYVDPARDESIADGLFEVWPDGPGRERLIERGIAQARLYGWDKVVPLIVATYARAAASAPSPSP
jgi:glycosyltransferase involved in cell wall biosynthesis